MLEHTGGLKNSERSLNRPIGALAGNKNVKKCHEYVKIYGPTANERRVGAFLGDSAQMFD